MCRPDLFLATAALVTALVVVLPARAQAPESRVSTFDRYLPDKPLFQAETAVGEHVDLRTLSVSWDVEDLRLPGPAGLDIVVRRSFGRLRHAPSEMGHWYMGVPRIQIPTSPWRGPYDPARPEYSTFFAAWNNLWARTNYGSSSVCERAGALVDPYFRASLSNQRRAGALYAAGIQLHIPGDPSRTLLERLPTATQFPTDASYVTTDNWIARCLPATDQRIWGGFEVTSPRGTRYVFDFIQYLVPGDYGYGTTGGWVELGVSRVEDVHGNWLQYDYDLAPGGTALLQRIVASDGREVSFDYYPGSVLGVDVQGSPLALVSAVHYTLNGEPQHIRYDYCDFADLYLLGAGCQPVTLAPDGDVPVLTRVTLANGAATRYSYDPQVYSANVTYDWGGFGFQLDEVTLMTGGIIDYDYDPGYSPFPGQSNAPRPRLARRSTRGPDVVPGEWTYTYSLAGHLETTRISNGDRIDEREFYEGVGTYEFEIARRAGNYSWPDTAPYDFDELMGRLRRHTVYDASGSLLRETTYQYGLAGFVGKSWYGENWLGSPTLVLSQVRPIPETLRTITDYAVDPGGRAYSRGTPLQDFDVYMNPLVVTETGYDGASESGWLMRQTERTWHNDTQAWIIGLPASLQRGDYRVERLHEPATGLLRQLERDGVSYSFDYHPDGSLLSRTWVNKGQTYRAEFHDYLFGSPRLELHPIDPAAGRVARITRGVDELGKLRWHVDADGRRTEFDYDGAGWLTAVHDPSLEPVTIDYDVVDGRVLGAVQRQGERVRNTRNDGFGRIRRVEDQSDLLQYASVREYDRLGRLAFRSYVYDPNDPDDSVAGVTYEYDALSRVTLERRTADNTETRYCHQSGCNTGDYAGYDAGLLNGFVATDSRGFQTAYEFAAVGHPDARQLTRVVSQESRPTSAQPARFVVSRYERDAWMQVLAIEQGDAGAAGVRREFTYDAFGRIAGEDHPEAATRTYSYDDAGNVERVYDDGELFVQYQHDGLARVTFADYPDDALDIRFHWSAGGLLTGAGNGHSELNFDYTEAGQLAGERLAVGGAQVGIEYGYTPLGYRDSVTYPSGRTLQLAPDGFGRPGRVGTIAAAVDYWPDSRVRFIRYGNGVELRLHRDERRREAGRRVVDTANRALLDLDYDYDALANLTLVSDNLGWVHDLSLGYDGLGRLTAAQGYWGTGSITYDGSGNIRSRRFGTDTVTYQYDADNRLDAIQPATGQPLLFAYDELGNTLGDGLQSYVYNRASQLQSTSAQVGATFHYDGLGRRVLKTGDNDATVDLYTLDGQLVYSDRCSDDGITSEYYYLGRELLAREDTPCEQDCHP